MPKCAECGFLAARLEEHGELVGVGERPRNEGYAPGVLHTSGSGFGYIATGTFPLCFVQAQVISAEVEKESGDKGRLAVIQKERECDKFTPYLQDISPREHLDMLDRSWMLRMQIERDAWQRQCYEADRSHRESQAREEREYRDRQDATVKKYHIHQLLVLGFVTMLISSCSTILGSMIEGGHISFLPAKKAEPVQIQLSEPVQIAPPKPQAP